MIESFVDLTYRGLPLGRRIKLTQVRPSTGYLELPAPMPVGTQIAVATDEGVMLEVTVTQVFEQVGGSDHAPGMSVKPALGDERVAAWWRARVALPEMAPEPDRPRARRNTVRPRSHTAPQPVPSSPPQSSPQPPVLPAAVAATLTTEVTATKEMSVYVAEPAKPKINEEDIKKTTIMPAVDQELLAQLTSSDGAVESLVRRTGEHDVVDDGLRTIQMDAVDPAALGLDVSGAHSAVTDDGDDDDDDKKPKAGGKRKKKRR